MLIPLEAIREAAARTRSQLHRTPLFTSRSLGERAGVRLHLKCESFQKTGSFKPRGALNIVLSMAPERRERGLITVSAGNHAQAVAWAARAAGVPCTVVMPVDAPRSKMDAVRGYGAAIVPHGDRATLFDKLHEEEARTGATFVHPFDDPVGLAGAGTVGLEIVEQIPDVDCVVVAIGGGGLMAGVASAVKALKPSCRVIGVELEAGPGMTPALAAGKPIPVPRPSSIADGLTPPFVGAIPLQVARAALDDLVLVTEAEIVEAMRSLLVRAKLYVEGAGAAATAALLAGKARPPAGSTVVSIVSGGNVDPERALGAISAIQAEEKRA
ncbi:MAG TPA: threonine/serine dehydratase [Candidatus Eisenbacteria bacterium]|nr:threonine/serine dehydratase [Candidatus Eisenbacteria bacterium]